MINLLTDLKQAISRQRNKSNPNYDSYIYIYNQNSFDKSEKELLDIIGDTEKRITDNCTLLNELKNDARYNSTLKTFSDSQIFIKYSLYDNDKWQINTVAFSADKYFILETRKQFTKGFDIISILKNMPIEIAPPNNKDIYSYNALVSKYEDSLNDDSIQFTDEEKATENYQMIETYYKQYGKLTNNSTYCKQMIKATGDNFLKLYYQVRNAIKVQRYKKTELKSILQEIYKDNGIVRKAKETDLNEYNIQYEQKTIKGYKYIDVIRTQ